MNAYMQMFQSVKEVQMQVLDKELIRWKRDQQLAGNGHPMGFNLETLQEWCEGLADIIWTMRQQVRQLEGLREKLGDPQSTNLLPDLLAGITGETRRVVGRTVVAHAPSFLPRTIE